MRIFDILYLELVEFFFFILRWIPGRLGSRIRYFVYKNHLAGCGKLVNISVGCYIRDCKNISIGDNVGIGLFSQIYAAGNGKEEISIGDNVFLNSNVMINADVGGRIEIGNNILVGPNVVFRASNHICIDREKTIKEQEHKPGTIIVKDGVWIAANVSILPDVVIGRGSIIGAGSVVTKNVDDFTIVGGVPAKMIGIRE